MSEQPDLNWVERRHRAEKHLAGAKIGLWSDVCAALTDACRSFNRLYGGKSEVTRSNGHRLLIVLGQDDRIEVDFDNQAAKINVSYIGAPPRFSVKNFKMQADHLAAFIVEDGDDKRLNADEVSERILGRALTP
jgi:hypothetical protein